MERWSKTFLVISLAGLFLLAGAYVGAQEKAAGPAPEKAPETGKLGQMAPPASPGYRSVPPATSMASSPLWASMCTACSTSQGAR